MRLLANEMQVGDIVVLREGTAKIISIGLVASDYLYLPQFDDVNGWDLQHGRRVRWGPHAPYMFPTPLFGSATPALGPVVQPELIDHALRFLNSPPYGWQQAPLPPLPPEEPLVDVGQAGISPGLAELVGLALDLAMLYAAPERFGDPPAEHEMVAHFVVPLLRALGWQPEQIALEWRRIDVAVFHRLPRTPENLAFIVEAKRPHRGVESHLVQARDYLRSLGVERDVVVTDGLRYRLYAASQDYAPVAYANLERLKQSSLDYSSSCDADHSVERLIGKEVYVHPLVSNCHPPARSALQGAPFILTNLPLRWSRWSPASPPTTTPTQPSSLRAPRLRGP